MVVESCGASGEKPIFNPSAENPVTVGLIPLKECLSTVWMNLPARVNQVGEKYLIGMTRCSVLLDSICMLSSW